MQVNSLFALEVVDEVLWKHQGHGFYSQYFLIPKSKGREDPSSTFTSSTNISCIQGSEWSLYQLSFLCCLRTTGGSVRAPSPTSSTVVGSQLSPMPFSHLNYTSCHPQAQCQGHLHGPMWPSHCSFSDHLKLSIQPPMPLSLHLYLLTQNHGYTMHPTFCSAHCISQHGCCMVE